ncbi:MAG: hypothetical protein GY845_34990 [Planctomycetes bacterium]|nr:hypothetical protein [Planctomycetota bacterium]
MEEILAFKCCNLPDQNLEIHVNNIGENPVTVPGRFNLENENDILECSHLFPPWGQTIQPGTGAAFYCAMDESEWEQYQTLTIFDSEGCAYRFSTKEITEYQNSSI